MPDFKLPKLFDRKGDLSKRWYVGYYFKHPETGIYKLFQVWISSGLHTKISRYKEADRLIQAWTLKLKNGFNPFSDQDRKLKSISECLDYVLSLKERTTKRRTFQTYKSIIKLLKTWLERNNISNLPVDSFGKIYAQEYMDYLTLNRKISGRTHNNILIGLRSVFNELFQREYILRNPFSLIKPVPKVEPGICVYSITELQTLKGKIHSENPGLWLFCEFVFYCAIRPAELVRIRIEDIDLQNRSVRIQAANSKNNKTQVVSIPKPLFESLEAYNLGLYPKAFYLFSRKGFPGSLQVAPVRYSEMFRVYARQLGFPDDRKLYDLKHTGAGIVIENGANINDLRLHLRHSDISQTDHYLKRHSSSVSKAFLEKFPEI